MWPLLTGVQPVTVAMHDAPIKEIAWIPAMNLLATGSWEKTLKYVYYGSLLFRLSLLIYVMRLLVNVSGVVTL